MLQLSWANQSLCNFESFQEKIFSFLASTGVFTCFHQKNKLLCGRFHLQFSGSKVLFILWRSLLKTKLPRLQKIWYANPHLQPLSTGEMLGNLSLGYKETQVALLRYTVRPLSIFVLCDSRPTLCPIHHGDYFAFDDFYFSEKKT